MWLLWWSTVPLNGHVRQGPFTVLHRLITTDCWPADYLSGGIAAGWLIKGVKAMWPEDTTGSSDTSCVWWCFSVRLIQSKLKEHAAPHTCRQTCAKVPGTQPTTWQSVTVEHLHVHEWVFFYYYSAGPPHVQINDPFIYCAARCSCRPL